jgi:hypothetical protein
MHVQVNTDNQIDGHERMIQYTQNLVGGALGRFGDWVTRVEVHLTDENSASKDIGDDKRCVMEARLAGRQPAAVTHHAPSIDEALNGALAKLEKVLNTTLEKKQDALKRG